MEPVCRARNSSSAMNGRTKTEAKGHPRMPPTANQKMPAAVLRPPFQSIKDDSANMFVYMAKLDGR